VVYGGVVRAHAVANGVVDLYFSVVFALVVLGFVKRILEVRLLAVLGWRGLRRVRALARAYALRVSVASPVLGVHGRVGAGSRALFPLSLAGRRGFREVGVDLVLPEGVPLPKVHLKVYTTKSPYSRPAGQRSLLEFLPVARGR
jgi:hypothetical protein